MSAPTQVSSDRERELRLTEDDIRAEHVRSVNVLAHWTYLFAVLGGGLVLMVLLLVALSGTTP
jgi:hypothetical protein